MQVVVLNDGETYSSIEGVKVLNIPDDVYDTDTFVKEHYFDEGISIKEVVREAV